jgi:hypothetical protein
MKSFALGIILVVALTVASAVVQGRMSNRWGPSEDMLTAGKQLETIPTQFGDWRVLSSQAMSEEARNELEPAGYIYSTYRNQKTGETINMTLFVGPTGPTAVHTPEICYSSRAHKQLAPRETVTLPDKAGGDDKFWSLTFRSTGVDGEMLQVYYAWSTGDHWLAAGNPRFSLAGQPYLYKIQLAGKLPLFADLKNNDPCRNFLRDFIPVARPHLIEPSRNKL